MKTSVETLDPVQVKLTVEVEPKRVKQAFAAAARELAKQVTIPGFRPGKAPRRLLEQRFGDGVLAQTAMEATLSDYYVEALRQESLDAVGQPDVDVETFDEEEGCTFTATVEVRPKFDPPDHTGIEVTFPDWDLDEDAVDEQLEALRERFAEVEEVERPAESGDYVTLDLRVEVDGEELEASRVEDALYEIGSQGVTPKLDEEAVGKVAGDEFTYVDDLPEEYPNHGGETATFHVSIKDVREKNLPDLDDDFAMTASGFDTLEELRDDITTSLRRRQLLQAQHDLRGNIVEAYVARVDVPLPPSMVEADKEQRLHQLEHQAQQFGVSVDELLEVEGTSREEFEQTAARQAEQTVKARLVLEGLAQQIRPSIDPSEIDQEIVRHAQATGVAPEEIARIIQEQGTLPALIGDVVRRKTIDAIVEAAEVDGAPSDEVLVELGLKADPAAEEEETAEGAAESADAASKLIIPGQDTPAGGGKLIVPGADDRR